MQPNHRFKSWKYLLSLLCLVLFSSTALSDTFVLKGSVGKYPILMELSIGEDDTVTGRYAYNGKLIAIHLEGKDLQHLTEFKLPARMDSWEEAREYEFEPNAVFNGALRDQHYTGIWTIVGRQKGLAFDLAVVTDSRSDRDKDAYYDLFDFLISQQMQFNATGDVQHADGHKMALESYEEPVTGVTGVRLANLKSKQAQAKINQALKTRHKSNVEASLWCLAEGYVNAESSVGHAMESPYFEILYYGESLLEIAESSTTYCGSAHPSHYYNLRLFDTETGEQVDLTAMFTVYDEDDAGRESISPEFETVLLKYLDKGHQCIMEEAVSELSNNSIALHMTQDNTVSVKFDSMGHAAFVCELDDIAVIPIEALRDLALPAAAKYFPMLAP